MTPAQTSDWDAKLYHQVSSFQEDWARKMLDERAGLTGDETVLDAGCGSGRVTRMLIDRLPSGRVIGVDAAPSMIAHALETVGGEATLIESDLASFGSDQLEAEAGVREVDLVFSNATFHWVLDHDALFRNLHAVLRPGGRLVAQCGAEGNVAAFGEAVEEVSASDPFEPHLRDWERRWNFSSRDDAERRLRDAGFDPAKCWITDFEAAPEDPRAFMRASGFAPIFEQLPEEQREPFVDAVFELLPKPVVFHYVRLNIAAVKPRG